MDTPEPEPGADNVASGEPSPELRALILDATKRMTMDERAALPRYKRRALKVLRRYAKNTGIR